MTPPLWSRRSLVVMITSSVLGLCAMILASYGASAEEALADQIGWLNLAVLGTVVAGAGQASLLIAARRTVTLRREELVGTPTVAAATFQPPTAAAATAMAGGLRVQVNDGTWHHAPDCVLVRGKPITIVADPPTMPACTICGAS